MDQELTRLLHIAATGDREAHEQLWRQVYQQLRALANRQMRGEKTELILQPTALVHEVFLRLVGPECASWDNRRHFFSAASTAMVRIRVDEARKRLATKRGGDLEKVRLDFDVEAPFTEPIEVLAIHEALETLRYKSDRAAKVVEYRVFMGFNVEETADLLDVSKRTVTLDWRMACAWLHRELVEKPEKEDSSDSGASD